MDHKKLELPQDLMLEEEKDWNLAPIWWGAYLLEEDFTQFYNFHPVGEIESQTMMVQWPGPMTNDYAYLLSSV